MGAGVSLPEARRILQEECQSTVPHIQAQLTSAHIVGCNSLRGLNAWYRVHADEHKLVARVISKHDTRPFIIPSLPREQLQDAQRSISLDGYLDELLSLQLRHPTAPFSFLDDADAAPPPAAASSRPPDGWRKLSRQDSRLSNRSDNEATPSALPSAPHPTSHPPPTAAFLSSATLAVPNHSPLSSVSSSSSTPSLPSLPPLPPTTALASQPQPTSTEPPPAHEVAASELQVVEGGEGAVRAFLVAFLDVLYTARQRRASSVFGGEQGPPFSPTGASFSAGASSSLSRRHLRSIHPNLPAVDEVLETPSSFVLLTKHFPRTLAAYLRTGSMRSESDEAKLFVLYQCLQCLHFLHERGMVHGNLKTRNVMVTGNQWVYLTGLQCPAVPPPIDTAHSQQDSALMRWVRGDLSNFDYLMELNRLAGREAGATDVADHPILPWVTDFTSPTGNPRDLSKSKFRLKKGDQQLDFTFQHSTSNPHHITELFSDITYHVYLARVTPLHTLKKVVRERFVAAEYPPSMARIFAWTPDECIPEFFSDPAIFSSRHKELGLEDLAVPAWCAGAAEFVRWHRSVLESDEVSRALHDWVDITFGYKLSGEAAIEAKNVPLRSNKQSSRRSAFVQLFTRPHPKRMLGGGMREEKQTEDAHKADDEVKEAVEQPKPDSERKEGDGDAVTANGEEATTDNGDADVVEGAATTAPSAAAVSIDYSIRNLYLLQEAASFDAVFTALEGCYLPIHGQSAAPTRPDACENSDDEGEAPAPTPAPALASAATPVYHTDSIPEPPLSPALSPPPPPPPPTPLETLRLLQADDVFSLGCVIAELFLGHPLFSPHTHALYAMEQFTPTFSSIPLSIHPLLLPMLHPDPSQRPTASTLLHHPVFTHLDAYPLAYNFISELRRQQSTFSHSSTPPASTAPAAHHPLHLTPPTSDALQPPPPPLHPYPPSSLSLSFQIPSDDIHTPPVRSSALMDLAMVTPPEFSPLALAVKEREREERERSGEEGVGEGDGEDEGVEEEQAENAEVDHEGEGGADASMPAKSAEPVTRQQLTLDWALDQLESLSSLPLPVYLLLLPHALSLTSHPELFIPSIPLLMLLSKKLGPTLSTQHLSPSLHTLLLHVDNLDLQCELLSFATLRHVYTHFSYRTGGRDYLSYCRNSLLSPNWRISDAASASLYSFLVEQLDLAHDLDQELAVRDVLLPIMSRVGRGASEVLLKLLTRLVPEVNVPLLQGFFLPHALQMIEKGAHASSEYNRAELDLKLACGLDLLYAMLPDLPLPTFQALLSDGHALKGLLAGTSRGPLSAANVRRLLRVLLFIVVEFSGENDHVKLNEHGQTSAIGLKNLRLILPLLPLFADFLHQLSTRMDAVRDGSASQGGWDAAACYEFMRTLYVGLSVTVGPTIVRKAVASHARIEGILVQGPPMSQVRRKSGGLVGVQNVFGGGGVGGGGSGGGVDLTKSEELDRVLKHGVLGRVKRGGWEEREEKRHKERRERLLKARQEEGEVLSLGGMGEVHENWLGLPATADDERKAGEGAGEEEDEDTDEEADEGEERFTRISRPAASAAPPRPLSRAMTTPVSASGAVAGGGARSFFSFLSSSASSSSIPLTMELAELWSVDTSNAWKAKGVVKQTLQPHATQLTALCCHPSSALFITAARDEMVKVWSVGIGSGEVHAGAVYRGHKGTVTEVELLMEEGEEECRWVGTSDGALHVWDIETAVCTLQSPFPGMKGGADAKERAASSSTTPHAAEAQQAITCLRYAGQRSVLIGTSLGHLRHLDLRTGSVSGTWRHLGQAQPVAAVRCLTRSPHGWLATGLSTGEVTVMDARTGVIRLQWRAHETAVLSLHSVDEGHLLSCGGDRSVVVWDIAGEEVAVAQRWSGLEDSVRAGWVEGTEFVGVLGGKLAVGALSWEGGGVGLGDKKSKAVGSKMSMLGLKGSKARGALTALAFMPTYRLMLVGAEDGKLMITA